MFALRLPMWVPPVAFAAVSLISNAFDVDDMALWNYANNVVAPSPLVWGPGYFDWLPAMTAVAVAALPLPIQTVCYRIVPIAAAVVVYCAVRELFRQWHPQRAGIDALALTIVLALNLIDPALLANLTWVNWSAILAAIAYLLARLPDTNPIRPAAAVAIVIGLLTTPVGLVAVPILLVGLRRDRVLIAAVVVAAHALQAAVQPAEWTLRPSGLWSAFADELSRGTWLYNIVIAASTLLVLVLSLLAAVQLRHRVREHAALCLVGAAALTGFMLSGRLADQGFEPRYVLIPAFCALVALVDWLQRLPAERARLSTRTLIAMVAAITVIMFNIDRRGPIVTWLQKLQFSVEAQAFRESCSPGSAIALLDEPFTLVVECRPQRREPGQYYIVGARPMLGTYSEDAPVDYRPSVTVPDRIF